MDIQVLLSLQITRPKLYQEFEGAKLVIQILISFHESILTKLTAR